VKVSLQWRGLALRSQHQASVQEALDGKAPVLVFVATRTGALEHSQQLAQQLEEAELGATAFKIFSFQQYSLQLNTNPQDCIAKERGAQVLGVSVP
jgi:hypothetical protein